MLFFLVLAPAAAQEGPEAVYAKFHRALLAGISPLPIPTTPPPPVAGESTAPEKATVQGR